MLSPITIIRRLFGPLIGFSFAVIVLFTSLFGNYIITLLLPMISIFNHHKLWRSLMDRAFFLHYIYGVKVRVSGDSVRMNAPSLIIMNHRTRLDWLYFWLALWRINPWLMTTNKIALKELLRYVPAAGFGMQAIHYVFLRRDLNIDMERMSRAINYYSAMEQPFQLLIFPEGTDKTDHTTQRSREFTRKNGFEEFKNVLYPRTAGFIHLVKEMKKFAYPKDIVQNETDMILKGRLSSTVHYDICEYNIDEIPTETDEQITDWLIDKWRKKDEKLEKFYAEKSQNRRRLQASGERNVWHRDSFLQKFIKIYVFSFWILVVSVWLYHLQFLIFVQVGFAYLILSYLYIYGIYGGIDNLVHEKWKKWDKRNVVNHQQQSSVNFV